MDSEFQQEEEREDEEEGLYWESNALPSIYGMLTFVAVELAIQIIIKVIFVSMHNIHFSANNSRCVQTECVSFSLRHSREFASY